MGTGVQGGVQCGLAKAHERANGADQDVALANQCANAGRLLNVGDCYLESAELGCESLERFAAAASEDRRHPTRHHLPGS